MNIQSNKQATNENNHLKHNSYQGMKDFKNGIDLGNVKY